MDTITLQWEGPFSLRRGVPHSLFPRAVATKPEIYLWTVSTDQGYLVQYVGETGKTFRSRHPEHLASYHSGSYSIQKAAALKQGRLDPAYKGFLYSKRKRAEREPIFLANRKVLLAELGATFDLFELFLAPLRAAQRLRRRIETAIARSKQ